MNKMKYRDTHCLLAALFLLLSGQVMAEITKHDHNPTESVRLEDVHSITPNVTEASRVTPAAVSMVRDFSAIPTLNELLLISQNVSATFDFNLPRPLVPGELDKSIKEAMDEELYWDHDKFGPQKGIASLYGSRFHLRRTTSGERYDKTAATAAHKMLPFGTEVLVTNMEPGDDFGKSVKVRINDRGPFIRGRIIDLSRDAARRIGLTIGKGVSKVKLELLKPRGKKDQPFIVNTANIQSTGNMKIAATENIK